MKIGDREETDSTDVATGVTWVGVENRNLDVH